MAELNKIASSIQFSSARWSDVNRHLERSETQ